MSSFGKLKYIYMYVYALILIFSSRTLIYSYCCNFFYYHILIIYSLIPIIQGYHTGMKSEIDIYCQFIS